MNRRIAAIALVLAMAAAPAFADALSPARDAGLVGERPDGLVGVVSPSAPKDIAAEVARINQQRLAAYQGVAAKAGTSVDAVQARAGAKLIGDTPTGQYVMNAAGQWVKR